MAAWNFTQDLVSVIVPVYNVERTLDQALNSIEVQSHQNLEIIVVNDGSTDGSGEIIQRHAAADDRYHVIEKPNGGYGSACNRGLDEAQGQWIALVEPDDWILSTMYGDMLRFATDVVQNKEDVSTAANGAAEDPGSSDEKCPIDIIKTPYWRVWMADTDQQSIYACNYQGLVRPPRQPFTLEVAVDLLRFHPSIWSALYRRSFLEENSIRFVEAPGAGWVDNPFVVETLCRARSIVYLDRAYYYYREETPDETRVRWETNPLLAIDRWHDMQDIIDRLPRITPLVLAAQYSKAFGYLDHIMAAQVLDDAALTAVMEDVFKRMDPEIVWALPDIPPRLRTRFAETRGLSEPKRPLLVHEAYLLGRGVHSLRTNGLGQTLRRVKRILPFR